MRRSARTFVVGAAVTAIVIAANASQGAYFSQSWGWVALAFLVPTTVLLILDRVTVPGRLRIACASLMGALIVWTALSVLWSLSSSASVREVERTLVYLAAALAVALVLRRGDGPGVLAGLAVGIASISAYALATRLFPDRFDAYDDPVNSYRLAEPLGYWNALGIFATMGLVLALGFVAHTRRGVVGVVAAATVPALALALYFTFSRGAWAALGIGILTSFAVDPRRLRLAWTSAVIAVPPALCIAYASRQAALTTEDPGARLAAEQGHRVAFVLGVAMLASALLGIGARMVAARLDVSRAGRRVFDFALAGATVLVAIAGLLALGGPAGIADRFNSAPVPEIDLNDRLFTISANGRQEPLGVAWDSWQERPMIGQGAGSFEYAWYELRPSGQIVRDAHSLYVETLMELGVVGFGLLAALLVLFTVGALRARRQRFVAAGIGAVAAWAGASAFDWHWEMVGVTLVALLAGSAGLLASERPRSAPKLLGGTRLALAGVMSVLSVLAVWSLVGNQALFAAREAVAREEWADAWRDARHARALLPWSFEPDLVLGDAAAGLGDRDGALAAYRDATATDPLNWVAWLHVAQVARGAERAAAYDRVRMLNPLEEGLPGDE